MTSIPGPERVLGWQMSRLARRSTLGWGAFAVAFVIINVVGYLSAYPDLAERLRLAAALGRNTGFEVLLGPARRLETVGGFLAWRSGTTVAILLSLWTILLTSRLLRGEEEVGRTELVLSGPISARRATATVLAVLAAAVGIVWAALTATLLLLGFGADLPVRDTLVYTTGVCGVAGVFAGFAAVCSQLAPSRRGAAALTGGLLAVATLLRAVAAADPSLRVLRVLSPLGWYESLRAFAGCQAGWLIPMLILGLCLLTASVLLAGCRDEGDALLVRHDTGPEHGRWLGYPVLDALRLGRSAEMGWVGGLLVSGLVFGLIAPGAARAVARSDFAGRLHTSEATRIGTVGGYLGLVLALVIAVAIAFQSGGAVAAIRDEESSGRLDTLLGTALGRSRWLLARLAAALITLVLSGLAVAVGSWAGQALEDGRLAFGSILGAALALLPPAVAFLGLGIAALGGVPRLASATVPGLVALAFVLQLVGVLVSAPAWVLDLSPFHHLSAAPAAPVNLAAALVLLAVGLAGMLLGFLGFRSRDLAAG